MLSQPLKDTTVTSEIREGAFEQGQTWSWEVNGKGLSEVFFWWSYRTAKALIHPLSPQHNSTTLWPPQYSEHCWVANIFTLKWTSELLWAGQNILLSQPANNSVSPRVFNLEHWNRNQSIKTSITYNYSQSPFTAKHHNPSQTDVCEKVHTPSKSGRI